MNWNNLFNILLGCCCKVGTFLWTVTGFLYNLLIMAGGYIRRYWKWIAIGCAALILAALRHISNFTAAMIKRFMGIVSKYRWLTVLIVIAVFASYPFIGLALYKFRGWNWGPLYTFEMSLEDFLTRWIAFWAFVGAGLNVLFLQRRVTVMDKQLRETRFTESVELLGNGNSSARIGGAYSLFYLAQDHADLRKTICDILCAHVRNTTRDDKYKTDHEKEPSNEIQTILDLLFQAKGKNKNLIFTL